MHPLVRDAIDICRRDGPREVVRRGLARIRRKYLAGVRLRLVPPLPPVRVNYTAGGVTARFAVTTPRELRRFLSPGGLTESPVHSDLVTRLRPDDVFYDVGANIGIYSCLAASVVREGRGSVLAFEPLRSNVESLERNAALNPGPVSIHDVALSDENATKGFDVYDEGRAGEGQGRLAPGDEGGGTAAVETRRGDDFVAEHGLEPPTVVKIDVEGAEMAVVRGMDDLLSSETCRLVYCEVHAHARWEPGDPEEREFSDIRDFDDQPGDVRETLEGMGYRVDRILDRDTPVQKGYLLRAERPD